MKELISMVWNAYCEPDDEEVFMGDRSLWSTTEDLLFVFYTDF